MKATTAVAKAMVGASTAITTETTKATTAVAVAVAKATTLARAVAVATQRRRMVVTAAAKSGAGIKTIHMEPKPLKKKNRSRLTHWSVPTSHFMCLCVAVE